MGWLQGRVHPQWEQTILMLQHDRPRTVKASIVIQRLLCASLETWYHAIWLPADHLTGEEPRIASRCQTPPHASTTAPSRECSRITHRQTASKLHRIEQGADGRASPLHGAMDARNSLTQHQRITMLILLITPYVVKLADIRISPLL